jgi:hypothetical protein
MNKGAQRTGPYERKQEEFAQKNTKRWAGNKVVPSKFVPPVVVWAAPEVGRKRTRDRGENQFLTVFLSLCGLLVQILVLDRELIDIDLNPGE